MIRSFREYVNHRVLSEMSDGDALLAAIQMNPEDDTPVLVYADWLDENDDHYTPPWTAGWVMKTDEIRRNPTKLRLAEAMSFMVRTSEREYNYDDIADGDIGVDPECHINRLQTACDIVDTIRKGPYDHVDEYGTGDCAAYQSDSMDMHGNYREGSLSIRYDDDKPAHPYYSAMIFHWAGLVPHEPNPTEYGIELRQ